MKWLRRNQAPDLRPRIDVVISPNNTSRQYDIEPEYGSLTETPHREMFGMDAGRLYKYPTMDEPTRLLYDAVRALDRGIADVSILPQELTVDHEWRATIFNRVTADWLPDFDAAVVDCLAKHMGWEDGAQFTVRKQTEDEVWQELNTKIAAAVRQGLKPPVGWPYSS